MLRRLHRLSRRARSVAVAASVQRDVAYGSDPAERYDVYAPTGAEHAPVLFFVHDGGWARGANAAPGLLDAKLAHWLPLGYVVISVDYPLLPDAHPLGQARDVAGALAQAQAREQASASVAKASSFRTAATLVEEDLTHAEINRELGNASTYTDTIDAFMHDRVTRAAPMR